VSDRKATIVRLPGARIGPETVLHGTINKASRIKNVAVVIQWDDGSFAMDWSAMKSSELAAMSLIFQQEAVDVLRGAAGIPCKPEEGQ